MVRTLAALWVLLVRAKGFAEADVERFGSKKGSAAFGCAEILEIKIGGLPQLGAPFSMSSLAEALKHAETASQIALAASQIALS